MTTTLLEYLGLAVVVYLAAAAEIVLGDCWSVGSLRPDLLALVACMWLRSRGSMADLVAIATVGLVADLVSPGRLGINLFALAIMAAVLIELRQFWPRRGVLALCGWVLVGISISQVTSACIARLLGELTTSWSLLLGRSLAVAVYTVLLALPGIAMVRVASSWRAGYSGWSPGARSA